MAHLGLHGPFRLHCRCCVFSTSTVVPLFFFFFEIEGERGRETALQTTFTLLFRCIVGFACYFIICCYTQTLSAFILFSCLFDIHVTSFLSDATTYIFECCISLSCFIQKKTGFKNVQMHFQLSSIVSAPLTLVNIT